MVGLGSFRNSGESIQDTKNKSWKKSVDLRKHEINMESVTLRLIGAEGM